MQERWEAEQRLWLKGAASGRAPLSTCMRGCVLNTCSVFAVPISCRLVVEIAQSRHGGRHIEPRRSLLSDSDVQVHTCRGARVRCRR